MKTEEFRALVTSIKEMSKCHADTAHTFRAVEDNAAETKKLWKSGNRSLLIKAGLALLVFPEPVVSDMLGTALLAAGAVQEGIKRQSVYVDELPRAFKSALKELEFAKQSI